VIRVCVLNSGEFFPFGSFRVVVVAAVSSVGSLIVYIFLACRINTVVCF
jgi:hypothetical protein